MFLLSICTTPKTVLDLAVRRGYPRAAFTSHEIEPQDPYAVSLFPHLAVGLCRRGLCLTLRAAPFDAAPFGLPLPEGNGVMWEDPREIHKVVVHFASAAPAPETSPAGILGQPLARATSAQRPRAGRRRRRLDGTWQLVHRQMARGGRRSQGRRQYRHVHLPSGQCQGVSQTEGLPRHIPVHAENPRGVRGSAAEDRAHRGLHRFDARTAQRQSGVEIRARGEGQLRGV